MFAGPCAVILTMADAGCFARRRLLGRWEDLSKWGRVMPDLNLLILGSMVGIIGLSLGTLLALGIYRLWVKAELMIGDAPLHTRSQEGCQDIGCSAARLSAYRALRLAAKDAAAALRQLRAERDALLQRPSDPPAGRLPYV